jgi:hypothetical protein
MASYSLRQQVRNDAIFRHRPHPSPSSRKGLRKKIIALFISSSNSILKTMSPLIAPNISKLSILLNEIDFLDSQFMKTIQTNRETEQNQSVEEEEAEEEE